MRRRRAPIDDGLLLSVLTLTVVGIVLVYSASFPTAGRLSGDEELGDPYRFLKSQVAYGAIGVLLMAIVSQVAPSFFRRSARVALLVAGVLLVLVFTPLGLEMGGSRRWLQVGPITFQPSEFAKIALILFLARYLSERRAQAPRFGLCLRALGYTGLLAGLTLVEPDLGTAMVVCLIGLLMLFLAGARLWQVGAIGLSTLGAAGLVVAAHPYMKERLLAFLDPIGHVHNSGYHVIRMMVALANGGGCGVGIGEGVEKWSLPARHTDSIYCVLGEELGFLGCAALLLLFAWFVKRAFTVAVRAPDAFTRLAAGGLAGAITFQAVINIAVATACLPVTGLTLPFVSSGGSSLAMMLLAAGVLLSISRVAPHAVRQGSDAAGPGSP